MAEKNRLREVRVLVACMPKSGSTLLTTLVAALPGMRRAILVPGYQRREQEICLKKLTQVNLETQVLRELFNNKRLVDSSQPRGFATQMHIRYSMPTSRIMDNHGITPVVLVRNIFDVVVSVRDHFRNIAPFMSMAYVSEEMRRWPAGRMHEFIADMVIPWYLNFFVCWGECQTKLLVSYEELTDNPGQTLRKVADHVGLSVIDKDIEAAITQAIDANTRKNMAVVGRGQDLAETVKEKIHRMAAYYPDVDFSPIGLHASESSKRSLVNNQRSAAAGQ